MHLHAERRRRAPHSELNIGQNSVRLTRDARRRAADRRRTAPRRVRVVEYKIFRLIGTKVENVDL